MKALRIFCTLVVLLLGIHGAVNAAPPAPQSIISLTISPSPVIAGSTVYITWDMDLKDAGTAKFRLSIPADWYNGWEAGTDVTVIGDFNSWTDSTAACTTNPIGGITMVCNEWETIVDGSGVESINVSFTVKAGATLGSNRPLRAVNNAGSATPPNTATVYVTVQGAPTTRYIANTGECGAYTPCDAGANALQAAIAALPTAGGTIYVIGEHNSSGATIGTKNIILRPVDSNAALNGLRGECQGTLLKLDGTGNLTVDELRIAGEGQGDINNNTCFVGVGVTGAGNLTVQNGAIFASWYGNGASAGYGVNITGGNGAHSISDATFEDNATGLNAGAGAITVRGNTFSNNSGYAFDNTGGTLVAYANNITGNNGGGYQANTTSNANVAKNWWDDAHNASVGPTGAVGAAGWNARLGASVKSWAAGIGSVTLDAAQLTDGGMATGVIMNLGNGSANAPFGNGTVPNVNQTCSPFYDFYALSGTSWKVHLPINIATEGCLENVLFQEIAYQIVNKDNCADPGSTTCWELIPNGQIQADSGNHLLIISGLDLSGTHIVAGDREGLGPTSVALTDFSAAWQGDAVRVTWETAQEIDNLGFNIHRANTSEGLWEQVNLTLVPSQAPGALFGATYEWVDENVTPGEIYLYRLEDVDIYSMSTFHGPISTTPPEPSTVRLVAFGAQSPVFGVALVFPLGWLLWRKRRK